MQRVSPFCLNHWWQTSWLSSYSTFHSSPSPYFLFCFFFYYYFGFSFFSDSNWECAIEPVPLSFSCLYCLSRSMYLWFWMKFSLDRLFQNLYLQNRLILLTLLVTPRQCPICMLCLKAIANTSSSECFVVVLFCFNEACYSSISYFSSPTTFH